MKDTNKQIANDFIEFFVNTKTYKRVQPADQDALELLVFTFTGGYVNGSGNCPDNADLTGLNVDAILQEVDGRLAEVFRGLIDKQNYIA